MFALMKNRLEIENTVPSLIGQGKVMEYGESA